MIGLLDIGGGMRCAYSAGVLDCFLAHDISFDYCCGISAGAANMTSYLAGQKGRNIRFYTEYSHRHEYAGPRNVAQKHCLLDLDYIYRHLSKPGGECPLDFEVLGKNPTPFFVEVTRARDGAPVYFRGGLGTWRDIDLVKASSALPLFCRPQKIDGEEYFDGGVADPLPIEKCFADGCTKLVVILNRPADEPKQPEESRVMQYAMRHYPAVYEQLRTRHLRYNAALEKLHEYAREGRAIILAPEKSIGVGRMTRDSALLGRYYAIGYQNTLAALPHLPHGRQSRPTEFRYSTGRLTDV